MDCFKSRAIFRKKEYGSSSQECIVTASLSLTKMQYTADTKPMRKEQMEQANTNAEPCFERPLANGLSERQSSRRHRFYYKVLGSVRQTLQLINEHNPK